MELSAQSRILMIGSDQALSYLIGRFAERCGYGVSALQWIPSAAEARALEPAAVLFQSLERLESSQTLAKDLAECDVPVLVCSSVADEARARELGADRCLLHPLTYESLLTALSAAIKWKHLI